MDSARQAERTNHPATILSAIPTGHADAGAEFQRTVESAKNQRPEDRTPALLVALTALQTLPQSAMPAALIDIVLASYDLPEEPAALFTDALLAHYPALTTGSGQDKATADAKAVAETMLICAVNNSPAYQVQLLCKLADVAAELAIPMFGEFLIQQLTLPLILPHCSDPVSLVTAAAKLTKILPKAQQTDHLKMLYRLANEQTTERLSALEALREQSHQLPLSLGNVDFLQTLNQTIYRTRLAQV